MRWFPIKFGQTALKKDSFQRFDRIRHARKREEPACRGTANFRPQFADQPESERRAGSKCRKAAVDQKALSGPDLRRAATLAFLPRSLKSLRMSAVPGQDAGTRGAMAP